MLAGVPWPSEHPVALADRAVGKRPLLVRRDERVRAFDGRRAEPERRQLLMDELLLLEVVLNVRVYPHPFLAVHRGCGDPGRGGAVGVVGDPAKVRADRGLGRRETPRLRLV